MTLLIILKIHKTDKNTKPLHLVSVGKVNSKFKQIIIKIFKIYQLAVLAVIVFSAQT